MTSSPSAPSTPDRARYDGLADWYDAYNAPAAAGNHDDLAQLLGEHPGRILDLGCGTGLYTATLRSAATHLVGVDRSADQLRVAATRNDRLVQADAAALPFADAVFDTVTAMWITTDVDDLPAVLREAARVLSPGGRLISFGVHPCFNGPHVEYRPDRSVTVHPTYRHARWHTDAPWWGANIRSRVGMRQVPLPDLLNAFIGAGLTLTRIIEPRTDPIPVALAVTAAKPSRAG